MRKILLSMHPDTGDSTTLKMIARVLVVLLVLLTFYQLWIIAHQFLDLQTLVARDITQVHLMCRAIAAHQDPYQSIPTLTNQFFNLSQNGLLNHPPAYPPFTALLFYWLGVMQPITAELLWLALSVACGITGVIFLFHWNKIIMRPWFFCGICGFFFLTLPVQNDLLYGQFSLLLFGLISGCLYFESKRQDFKAGILLGLALSIKLFGILLVIYYFLRRRHTLAITSTGIFLIANLFSIFILGWPIVRHYYEVIGPQVTSFYMAHVPNWSLLTIGAKTLGPLEIVFRGTFFHHPSQYVSTAGITLSWIAFIFAAVYSLFMSLRSENRSISALIVFSLLCNPVTWTHTTLLLVIPLATLLVHATKYKMCKRTLVCLLGLGCFFLIDFNSLPLWYASQSYYLGDSDFLDWRCRFLTLIPTIIMVLSGYLLLSPDSNKQEQIP